MTTLRGPRLLRLLLVVLLSIDVAAAASAQPVPTPDLAPELYVLAHVDIETTGLDPAVHEMVSIGMIYTDLEGANSAAWTCGSCPRTPSGSMRAPAR